MMKYMTMLVSALLISAAALAQDQPPPVTTPPVLSELDAARLDRAVLQVENLQLRLQIAQQELQQLADSLAKEGYQLSRGRDGRWQYVRVEPPPTTH